ncbi:STM4014 family protein [Streptantibioticus parmotrematis]|uniref:STM4014 family protein n=1 Tax=Streptantibioticus parmotrematis TaxID=2873249 RepID=UPI0033E98774
MATSIVSAGRRLAPDPRRSARFTVVGNPGSRRVDLFRAAVLAAGGPEPAVLAWADVLRGAPGAVPAPGTLLRIDSPGEDERVDRLLRGDALGGGWDPTRVGGGTAWYERFTAALRELARSAAAVPGCVLLADPDEIAVMFDKRRTHALLADAAVPVPRALDQGGGPVAGWDDLRERLLAAGMPRAFVKPAHASSASGVVAVELGPRGRARATTSAALGTAADGRPALFNSLRVRRYTQESQLRALFDVLAGERLHVERWLPKASPHGKPCDLRVVVTAGRATHAVLRTSRHPVTNLHLGGARGDLSAFRDAAGPEWPAVLETCERTARLFPGSPVVAVDVLPSANLRGHAVGEVNAFGDLLPGLTGLPGSGAEGADTYAAFTAAVLRVRDSPRTADRPRTQADGPRTAKGTPEGTPK